jgi:hypothetical protein
MKPREANSAQDACRRAQEMRASPGPARRVDWVPPSLDVSMSAGWTLLPVLTALVLLDLWWVFHFGNMRDIWSPAG